MAVAPETPVAQTRAPFLRGLTTKPWFAVTAVLVAVGLVATGAIVAIARFGNPWEAPPASEAAPTAFPVTLIAAGSPMTNRGETVPMVIQAESPEEISAVELWEDDRLVLRIDDPENGGGDGRYSISLEVDHVPTTAGEHAVTTRLVTTSGHVGVSLPLDLATLDLPDDLGEPQFLAPGVRAPAPVTELRSVPGDTLRTIAGRLAVPVEALIPFISVGGPDEPLPAGSRVMSPVPTKAVAKEAGSYALPGHEWIDGISVEVEGCDAIVTSLKDETQLLYGGPGLLQIGEVPAKGELTLSGLPIGSSEIVAYVAGAKQVVAGLNAPSPPIKVVIPEECARSGWRGDAYVINDILVSETDVPKPYLYVAFDRGEWQRYPAGAADYLPLSTTADLRSFASFSGHNQIDLQLWSMADDGTASQAASGLFCRADMDNPDPANGSTAAGPCRPAVGAPGIGNGLAALPTEGTLTITARTAPPAVQPVIWVTATGPAYPVTQEVVLTDTATSVTLDIQRTPAYLPGQHMLQFTYTPISASSPLAKPPGLFATLPLTFDLSGHATVTFDPRKYDGLAVDQGGGADGLALDDQVALSLAAAQLLADDGLLTRFYVRAVHVPQTSSQNVLGNLASSTVQFDYGYPADPDVEHPQLVDPQISVVPGLQQDATWHSTNNRCLTVQEYPDPGVYAANPWAGPKSSANGQLYPDGYTGQKNPNGWPGWWHYGQPAGPGEKLITAGYPNLSDLDIALSTWKDASWVYCDEPAGPHLQHILAVMESNYINREPPDCGLVCVLKSTVMGAVIGFMIGGPYGAIVGAAIGLAVGLMSTLSPGLYDALTQLWDAVAALYNKIYSTALSIFDYLNPVCRIAGAADPDIGEACDTMSHIVIAVVVTAVTGLPPQLPTSQVIESLSDGNLESLIEAGIRIAMENLVSCDSLKVSGEQATAVKAAATSYGDNDVNATLASSTDANGDISACTAVAAIIAKQVRGALVEKHGEWMGAGYGMGPVPGLVMAPYADTSPTLVVSGGIPDASMKKGTTCEATMNIDVLWGKSVHTLKPMPFTLVVSRTTPWEKENGGTESWGASVPIPIQPDWAQSVDRGYQPASLVNTVKTRAATPEDRYLRIGIESPCIEGHYQLDLDYVGATGAFRQEAGPADAWYKEGYGLTWTPAEGSRSWF